jgi:hypothetical protein
MLAGLRSLLEKLLPRFWGGEEKHRLYFSETINIKVAFAVSPAWFLTTEGWRDENADSPVALETGTIGTLMFVVERLFIDKNIIS